MTTKEMGTHLLDDLVNRPSGGGDLPNHPTTRPLPDGWMCTTIGDIATVKGGKRLPKGATYTETVTTFPYIRVTDFTDKYTIDISDLKYIDAVTQELISRYTISKDDVYISIAGTIGKVGTIPNQFDGANLTENAAKITDLKGVSNKYLAYALSSERSKKQIDDFVTSSNQPKLALFRIEKIEIPLAPLAEQERIVAEIEKQFTRLDQAVVSLRRLQTNLSRYKASVLKAACEGRLVPQDPTDEPAEALLQRILSERRRQWQTTHPGKKYLEPIPLDTSNLPDLPTNWVWVSLSALASNIGDVDHRMPKAQDNGIPYISTKDFFGDNEINFSKAKRISSLDFENLSKKIRPQRGDILLSRYGTVGEVRIIETDIDFQASYSIAIIKMLLPEQLSKYLSLSLRSDILQKQIKRDIRATAQPDLGLAHIRQFAIPLPPLAEQHRIIAEVERRLSVITATEQAIITNLARAERLRQSILHRAFTGQLV